VQLQTSCQQTWCWCRMSLGSCGRQQTWPLMMRLGWTDPTQVCVRMWVVEGEADTEQIRRERCSMSPGQSMRFCSRIGGASHLLLPSAVLLHACVRIAVTGGNGDLRLVHPRIAAPVAEALGVASRRRLLLAASADCLALGLAGAGGAVEAFGQSEALTTRLRHIIQVCVVLTVCGLRLCSVWALNAEGWQG
jgi:hypothetical protein